MSAAGLSLRGAEVPAGERDRVAGRLIERFPGFEPDTAWARTADRYPARASDEYLELIASPADTDPVFRQIAPSPLELGPQGDDDPVDEAAYEAVPGLLHRFPDRALILLTRSCFVHCRHCMRKRIWNAPLKSRPLRDRLAEWKRYLLAHPEVREVILSGGDPLTLADAELAAALRELAGITHIHNIRIHTRAPVVAPSRITPALARLLGAHKVTRLVTQFNHPTEISPAARAAAGRLSARGISVENQSVLLAGVNDRPEVLAELFLALSAARVRPYYLHHPDPVRGAMHFYLDLDTGMDIFRAARRLAPLVPFPDYVADRPGIEGKIKVEKLAAKVI